MTLTHIAPLGLALLGLLLGMRHATDPDHVIAVTTILSREHRLTAAARIGIAWGLGHTLTMLAVGAAIIVFKLGIPARLGLAMEFAVAVVLILLGMGNAAHLMRRISARRAEFFGKPSGKSTPGWSEEPLPDAAMTTVIVHSHAHTHDGVSHRHPHAHSMPHQQTGAEIPDAAAIHHEHRLPLAASTSFAARRPLLRSFGVGLVHGVAGSAAIALLVLGAIPQPLWAALYLVIFCIGTIIGMAAITTAIAAPFMATSLGMSRFHQLFITSSGILSFGFGLVMAYQIGIVDGLFRASAVWTPH